MNKLYEVTITRHRRRTHIAYIRSMLAGYTCTPDAYMPYIYRTTFRASVFSTLPQEGAAPRDYYVVWMTDLSKCAYGSAMIVLVTCC